MKILTNLPTLSETTTTWIFWEGKRQKQPEKYKKNVYEEESDSEPEIEESQYVPEKDTEEEKKEVKQPDPPSQKKYLTI